METKVCKKCNQQLTLDCFSRIGVNNNNKRSTCKSCVNIADVLRNRAKAEKEGREVRIFRKNVSKEQKHKEMLEASRRYRQNNIEKKRKSGREWARKNKKKQLEYFVSKYASNVEFNLTIKIRRRIYMALRNGYNGTRKSHKTIDLLGCTYEYFEEYIVSKFTEGMSLDLLMKGKIHLDHIRPCKSFDLSKKEEQLKCFNYKNIQPLWATDNLKKGSKYE